MSSLIQERIEFIRSQLSGFPSTVYIGFSGGKDSSAVVKLLFNALLGVQQHDRKFVALYCDTGVENPVIDAYAKRTLAALNEEAKNAKVPFECLVIEPEVNRSFFVRLIGRGYPPPTNSFRWCTTDIRIRPFQRFLRTRGSQKTLIAIGTRMGESVQRDRSLRKSIEFSNVGPEKFYQKQREGFPGAMLFTPIIDFDVADVWETLADLSAPQSISVDTLAKLYKDGSGECPTVRDFKDKPCSKARFGCWTCTVVRRDRSAERMVQQGYSALDPFLTFRQWLLDIRNKPEFRCRVRRNGQSGMGPFNLWGREVILGRLNDLERETNTLILTAEQRTRIQELWDIDRLSSSYMAIES